MKQTLCEGEGSYTMHERQASYSLCVRACACERQDCEPETATASVRAGAWSQAEGEGRAEVETFQPGRPSGGLVVVVGCHVSGGDGEF